MTLPTTLPRTLGTFLAAALLAACSLALAEPASAASAVAVDQQSGHYAWRTRDTISQAEADARQACSQGAGRDCTLLTSCGLPGHAAIAFDPAAGRWGAVCGADDAAAAAEQAVENCQKSGETKGDCKVLQRYADEHPGNAVARGYFEGKWAADCDAPSWNEFRFVNAVEFRMMSCGPGGCKKDRQVFRPHGSESRFYYPTDYTRLSKRGPNEIVISQVDSNHLYRCEK